MTPIGAVLRRRGRCEEYRGNDKQAHRLYTLNHSPPSDDTSVVMWAFRDVDLNASIVRLESCVFADCANGEMSCGEY